MSLTPSLLCYLRGGGAIAIIGIVVTKSYYPDLYFITLSYKSVVPLVAIVTCVRFAN